MGDAPASYFSFWTRYYPFAWLRRQLQYLSLEDQVRVRERIEVGVGKGLPTACDVELLGDLAQGVALLNGVGLAAERNGGGMAGCRFERGTFGRGNGGYGRHLHGNLGRNLLDRDALRSCRRRAPAQTELGCAGRPGSPALAGLDLLGYCDLLFAAGISR